MTTYSPEQQLAVDSPPPRLLLIAGAGSGKSTTLCGRLVATLERGADPRKVIAISFTTHAARDMRAKLDKLGVPRLRHIGTIHALALAHADQFGVWAGKPEVVDEERQGELIRAALHIFRHHSLPVRDVAEVLACGGWDGNSKAAVVAKSVRRALVERGQTSMDLLLGEATRHLPRVMGQLDALFWDEVQDTAPGDYLLLEGIDAKEKTAVGDRCQAIYGFRGSSPRFFDRLAGEWEVLTLRDNYRSLPHIVLSANRLCSGMTGSIDMRPMRKNPLDVLTIGGFGHLSTAPLDTVAPYFNTVQTEAEEFSLIRQWLSATREQGTRAILCRHNALAQRIRIALADVLPAAPTIQHDPSMLRVALKMAHCLPDDGVTLSAADFIDKFDLYTGKNNAHEALPYLAHFMVPQDRPATISAITEALRATDEGAQMGDVWIGTVHGYKGLEADHVLIAGMDAALWPGKKKSEEAQEDARLAYVAVTRARDSLTITSARQRPSLFGQGITESEPSPYIAKL